MKMYILPNTKENRSKSESYEIINGLIFGDLWGNEKPPVGATELGNVEWDECSFSDICGKRVLAIHGCKTNSDVVHIVTNDGVYRLEHDQDCCEEVLIDDVVGDVQDIIGECVLMANETTNTIDLPTKKDQGSYTWTFYKLATIKGYLDIKWFGTSNGYYSEKVTVRKTYNPQFSKFLI